MMYLYVIPSSMPKGYHVITAHQHHHAGLNTADSVVAAIESVLADRPDFESLVVIDGSPDRSSRVIREFLEGNPDSHPPVRQRTERRRFRGT